MKGRVSRLFRKPKTVKLREEGMAKAETGRKLGLLCQTGSRVVNAKEKCLQEIKRATVESIRIGRKRNRLIGAREEVLVVTDKCVSFATFVTKLRDVSPLASQAAHGPSGQTTQHPKPFGSILWTRLDEDSRFLVLASLRPGFSSFPMNSSHPWQRPRALETV